MDHRKYEVALSLFHGSYHEDLMASVIKSCEIISKIIERKITLNECVYC